MKKKFIWIVLFVALVLLFAFLFLWPIQGSLYLNMNEDDGLNSSVYDLSTNRSKKVVIDDYNEVIDYYPLTGGYAAIGVNYVPAQNAAVDGLKSKYALVIHEGKRDFSYPLASSAGIMCVYKDAVYFTIYARTMLPHVTTSATCLILVLKNCRTPLMIFVLTAVRLFMLKPCVTMTR